MSWSRFILRRFLLTGITLFIVSLTIFAITQIIPGDTAQFVLGKQATPEALVAMRERMGLDRPAYIRYADWLWDAMHGDLGDSLYYDRPIAPLLGSRLLNSMRLAAMAFAAGVPLSMLLGIIAGLTPRQLPDNLISVATLTAVSLPEYVSGVGLMFIFGVWLGWLPSSSVIDPGANPFHVMKHLVLPVATLTLQMLAHISRMTRAGMIEVMQTAYVRTAYLKGLPSHVVILKHALRNALLPSITVIAVYVGWLMGGLIIVEEVFAYPGIGRLLILAIDYRDLPLLQSTALVIAAISIATNLVADVAYAYLNPRIRY